MSINFNLQTEYDNYFKKNKKDDYTKDTSASSNNYTEVQKEYILNKNLKLFETGCMTVKDFLESLSTLGISNKAASSNNGHQTIMFEFKGKKYAITCNSKAAACSNDNEKVTTFTVAKLKLNKLYDKTILAKYFDAVEIENGTVNTYALKDGYESLADVKLAIYRDTEALYQETKNKLVLNNFVKQDKNKTTNSATDMYKTSNGKTLSTSNFMTYKAQIDAATGDDIDTLKQEALNKFVQEFAQGNIAYAQVDTILTAIGVTKTKFQNKNGNYVISFEFNNKKYTITCNKDAAAKGTDDKTVTTYTADELEKYGVSQEIIDKYFEVASQENDTAKLYICKNPDLFTEIKNKLILNNFVNENINAKTNSETDMYKTNDDNIITSDNFLTYIEEIDKNTGDDIATLKQKALDKFVQEFAQGKIAIDQTNSILDAIGVTSKQQKQENGNYVISFEFNDDKYTVICNKEAAEKGTDDKTVTTCAADVIEKYGLSQEAIDKYFDIAGEKNDTPILYALKPDCGFKSFDDLKKAYEETKNELIMYNLLKSSKAGQIPDDPNDLLKIDDNNVLDWSNFEEYKDDIVAMLNEIKPKEQANYPQQVLNTFLYNFPQGRIAYAIVPSILNAIGATNVNYTEKGNNYEIKFDYNESSYYVCCSKSAAEKGNDTRTVKVIPAVYLKNISADRLNKEYYVVCSRDGKPTYYVKK